jgi:hypothetical protein
MSPVIGSASRLTTFLPAASAPRTALVNRILLENYYLPGDLEAQIGTFDF